MQNGIDISENTQKSKLQTVKTDKKKEKTKKHLHAKSVRDNIST